MCQEQAMEPRCMTAWCLPRARHGLDVTYMSAAVICVRSPYAASRDGTTLARVFLTPLHEWQLNGHACMRLEDHTSKGRHIVTDLSVILALWQYVYPSVCMPKETRTCVLSLRWNVSPPQFWFKPHNECKETRYQNYMYLLLMEVACRTFAGTGVSRTKRR